MLNILMPGLASDNEIGADVQRVVDLYRHHYAFRKLEVPLRQRQVRALRRADSRLAAALEVTKLHHTYERRAHIWIARGMLYTLLEMDESGYAAYENALAVYQSVGDALTAGHGWTLARLAELCEKTGQHERAEQLLEELLTRSSEFPGSWVVIRSVDGVVEPRRFSQWDEYFDGATWWLTRQWLKRRLLDAYMTQGRYSRYLKARDLAAELSEQSEFEAPALQPIIEECDRMIYMATH